MAADLTYAPKVHKADGGDTLILESGGKIAAALSTLPGVVQSLRARVLIAAVNAGATLLAAIPGYKVRMVNCKIIAYGGAVGTLTTVDILGTQTSGVKLAAFAQAGLLENVVLTAGGTNGAVLAAGASFVACDAGTAITIGKTGGTGDTATGVDVIFDYVLEVA
jgi:hypothetical protein